MAAFFSRRLVHFHSWPMAAKLNAALIAAVVVPIVLLSYFNLRSSLASLELVAYRNLEQHAEGLASRLDERIESNRQVVLLLSREPEIEALATAAPAERAGLLAGAQKTLENAMFANSDFSAAFVLDAAGTALASTNPAHAGRSYAFRDYFQHALRGEAYTSKVLVGTSTRQPGIYYSAPVKGPSGAVAGVVVTKLEGAAIWEVVDSLKLPGGEAFLVDEDGIIIAHCRRELLYHCLHALSSADQRRIDVPGRFQMAEAPSLNIGELAPIDHAAGPGHTSYERDGGRRIVGYAPLKEKSWAVGVDVDAHEFTRPLEELARRHWGAVALIGVATIVCALLFARSIVRPIQRLTKASEILRRGNYAGALVEVTSDDDLGLLAQAFNSMCEGLSARERERDIFGRVVSPAVREELLSGGLKLGGELRDVTVLFSDIRGFTTLSEQLGPQKTVTLLNEYLTAMTEAIRPFEGYINNFIGDAILVIFGAPVHQHDTARRAVAAALAMQEGLAELNAKRIARGDPPIASGIGVSTGEVIAGQVGSLERLLYTVIGDAVNVAARLEALTKDYPGRHILVNQPTAVALDGTDIGVVESLGVVTLKGKAEGIEIFAVMAT